MEHLAGKPLIDEYIRRYGRVTLQSFSRGKDSIACTLGIRDHLDIVPVHFVLVPGLEFVEESLDYYERKLFGRHIIRLPHPSFYRWLNNYLFQTVERAEVIAAADLPDISYRDVLAMAKRQERIKSDVLTAIGARAADSAVRQMSVRRHGPFRPSQGAWWAIWDWDKARLIREIQRANISLPIDYRLFGRSFDGLDAQYLVPLKRHCPKDYQRLLEWWPAAEAEVWLYENRENARARDQAA